MKFDDLSFEQLKETYENLLCKINEKQIYIDKLFKKDDVVYATIIDENLKEKNVNLKTLSTQIKPYSREDIDLYIYEDFTYNLKKKFPNRTFAIYADIYDLD